MPALAAREARIAVPLKPFEEPGAGGRVIRYDQPGGGESDKITAATMFTIGHFVQELDSITFSPEYSGAVSISGRRAK